MLPIEMEADRERRTARLSLPGVIEFTAEPIKNAVTGEEDRAQIRLPNGFECREAEMGNTTWLKVMAGPITFEHRGSYAQFNAFEWNNEPAACKRVGLPRVSWLTFRRTYSSWSHDKGVPGKVVAQLMGHANVDTTLSVYTQVLDGALRNAVDEGGGGLFTIVQPEVAGR